MPAPKDSLKYNAKELVAEQSGFFWTAVALIVALSVGSAVQSLLAPEKIKQRIQEVSTKIHPDVNVQFDDAYISLADGIFPEFALVIERVRLESAKTCWMMPVLHINKMKLPLSLSSLFAGHAKVNSLEVDEADLNFRGDYAPCKPVAGTSDVVRSIAQEVGEMPAPAIDENKNPIETVRVRVLKVGAVRFEDLRYQKQSSEGAFHIQGMLNLGAESLAGDFDSYAKVKLDFDPARERHWTVDVNGNWREGMYRVAGDYNQAKQSLVMSGEMKHLPMSQIFPVLKKYQLLAQDLDGKSLWLSSRFSIQGLVPQPESLLVALDDFKVEGEIGDIRASRIEVAQLKPLQFAPFSMTLQGIHLSRVLSLLGKNHPSPTLGELGVVSGEFRTDGKQVFDFSGDLAGLEFIFSNKGLRQSQVLSLVSFQWHQDMKGSHVRVTRVRPLEGIFEGGLEVNTTPKETVVVAAVNELQFAPSVIRLMTQNGNIDPMQGKMRMKLVDGNIVELVGDLKTNRMTVEGIEFLKPKVNFQMAKKTYQGIAEVEQISAAKDNAEMKIFLPLLEAGSNGSATVSLKKISMRFLSPEADALAWTDLRGQVDGREFTSSGHWNAEGLITGQFQKKSDSGVQKKWQLRGTRDRLEIHEN